MISEKWLLAHGFEKLPSGGYELVIAKPGGWDEYIYVKPDENMVSMCYNPEGVKVPSGLDINDCTTTKRLIAAARFLGYEFKNDKNL